MDDGSPDEGRVNHESLTGAVVADDEVRGRLRDRIAAAPRLARQWLVACLLVTLAVAVQARTVASVALVAWAALALARVPRRSLLAEGALAAAIAVGLLAGPATGCGAAVALVAVAAAWGRYACPEVGPQPFVGFDLCHLLLTTPIRPSTTHHFLELASPLDRGPLTLALADLVADVPRLRSFLREAPLAVGRFVAPRLWVDAESLVEWHDAPVDALESGWFERPFDLAAEPPVRLFHAPTGRGSHLFGLTLHHSVADGTGAMTLLDGLLRRYDRRRGREAPLAEILSEGPRCSRLALGRGPGAVVGMLVAAARRSTRGLRSATLVDDPTPRPARFAVRVVDVPPACWRGLTDRAAATDCTPNHLLMAASLRAADAVRRARGLADETFRVVVPSDLRKLFGLPRSIPNYIGTVPLDIAPDAVRSPSLPLRVRDAVHSGRSAAAQMVFPVQIGLLGLLPPSLGRRFFRRFDDDTQTSAFSFLFSHIRVPRDLHLPAAVDVLRFWCASSTGRQLPLGVAVTTVGARTWALIQYLAPYVEHDAAQRFERAFLAELELLAAPATREGAPCASA